MGVLGWIAIGFAAWTAVSAITAVIVGPWLARRSRRYPPAE